MFKALNLYNVKIPKNETKLYCLKNMSMLLHKRHICIFLQRLKKEMSNIEYSISNRKSK